ncbi:uncharacterized protein K460DRAFT_392954 [Cucurbitaria berberidis CBS 394.84]|uniref:Uncharacterized protein n=1 Tax=Cucurbitaria berberidis CBS 394.84 TaxID=1168544 RepID=A0A9P4GJX8_9PLEO|nr:uncharacterized protein K460DRAFT_392954 [Cucurbitaria berberidis CBS 394.84]KAF1847663.1 hypothetical protein K460DRAFT_392954 [Cucurbitaria berberidis CBS 394.84]
MCKHLHMLSQHSLLLRPYIHIKKARELVDVYAADLSLATKVRILDIFTEDQVCNKSILDPFHTYSPLQAKGSHEKQDKSARKAYARSVYQSGLSDGDKASWRLDIQEGDYRAFLALLLHALPNLCTVLLGTSNLDILGLLNAISLDETHNDDNMPRGTKLFSRLKPNVRTLELPRRWRWSHWGYAWDTSLPSTFIVCNLTGYSALTHLAAPFNGLIQPFKYGDPSAPVYARLPQSLRKLTIVSVANTSELEHLVNYISYTKSRPGLLLPNLEVLDICASSMLIDLYQTRSECANHRVVQLFQKVENACTFVSLRHISLDRLPL